jgi:hypothetical protein
MTSVKELWRKRKRKKTENGTPIDVTNPTQTDTTKESSYFMDLAWDDLSYFTERYNLSKESKSIDKSEVDLLIDEWQTKRATVYSKKDIDKSHKCSLVGEQNCSKSITVISKELLIYGCITSGKVHQCFRDEKCPTFTSSDRETICMYSKIAIGKITEMIQYTRTDASKEDNNMYNSDNELNENTDIPYEDVHEMQIQAKPLKSVLPEITNFIPADLLESEQIDNNKGNEGNKKDFVNEKKSKQRKCFDETNTNDVIEQARSVIIDLLFTPSIRKKINALREEENMIQAKRDVTKYYKDCVSKKVRPMITVVDDKFEHSNNKKRLYATLTYNEDKVAYYTNAIARLWKVIIKTPYCRGIDFDNNGVKINNGHKKREANLPQFHTRQHAVGCLYLMKAGYKIHANDFSKEINVFRKDQFLEDNLFAEGDLKDVPIQDSVKNSNNKKKDKEVKVYSKCDITSGRNNIKNSILSAFDKIEDMLIEEKLIS